jgi:hypothetical protein
MHACSPLYVLGCVRTLQSIDGDVLSALFGLHRASQAVKRAAVVGIPVQYPIRHLLGCVLTRAGNHVDAATVLRSIAADISAARPPPANMYLPVCKDMYDDVRLTEKLTDSVDQLRVLTSCSVNATLDGTVCYTVSDNIAGRFTSSSPNNESRDSLSKSSMLVLLLTDTGVSLAANGDGPAAVDALSRAALLNPTVASECAACLLRAKLLLARYFLTSKRLNEAVVSLQQAVEASPNSWIAHAWAGDLAFHTLPQDWHTFGSSSPDPHVLYDTPRVSVNLLNRDYIVLLVRMELHGRQQYG